MNILIVGFGHFGRKYYNLINQHYKDHKIYLLRHSKTNEKLLDYKISKTFYSLEETNEIKLDIVIITNPSCYHVETANYFLKKKIHCLVEKPLDSTYDRSIEIINNNDCCLEIGYLLRHSKLFEILLNYEKYIGKLLSTKINVGQYLPTWRSKDYKESVSSHKNMGGGVLLELSHDINYLLGFINNRKDYQIKSFSGKVSDLEIDVEDICNIIMKVNMKDDSQININLNLDMIDFNSNRTCKLIGENGTLVVDFVNKQANLFTKDNKNITLIDNLDENLLQKQFENFLNRIKINDYSNSSINDAIETLKIIDIIKNN